MDRLHPVPAISAKCATASRFAALWRAGLLLTGVFQAGITAAGLPDTGQDQCYDGASLVACNSANTGDAATYKRQDGRYGRDAAASAGELSKIGGGAKGFDYTALDTSGNPVPPSAGATPHPCVRDNVTGLVWEVKTDDGGLHDKDWTYTWRNTNASTNGGDAGSIGGPTCGGTLANCNTEALVAAVNATGWCGYSDWRMPSVRELYTLMHLGVTDPSLDTVYFPNFSGSPNWSHWAATPYVYITSLAWYVEFFHGATWRADKATDYNVRLVRGGLF